MFWLVVVACKDPEPARRPRPEPVVATAAADAGPDLVARVGEELRLSAGASVGNTFAWSFDAAGGGGTVFGAEAWVTFDRPGHVTAVLTVTDELGRTDTDSVAIAVTRPTAPSRSARPIAADDAAFYVVMPDFGLLAVVDRATRTVAHWDTCGRPRTVDVGPEGVWVACEDDRVVRHDPDGALAVDEALPYGSRPFGVVDDGRGGALVTLQGIGAVARLRPGRAPEWVAVEPDLRGLATVEVDGEERVFVSRWRSPEEGGVVVALDGALAEVARWTLPLDPGPDSDTNARGLPSLLAPLAVRPDGRALAVGGVKSNVARGLFRDGQPLTHESTSRADLRELPLVPEEGAVGVARPPIVFDDRDQVSGVAWSPSGAWLYVLHRGMETVDVLDPWTFRRTGTAGPVGAAPDGIVAAGDTLAVSSPLARELALFDLAEPASPAPLAVVDLLPESGDVRDPRALVGEIVFGRSGDPRMSAVGYLACATCHPEGEADGRTWDFTDRGEGLRNTTSLRGRGGRAPFHWTANFDELQDFENDIRGPQGGAGFLSDADFAATSDPLGAPKAGLSPELDLMAAYIASLPPLRAPARVDGLRSDAGRRGEVAFADAGCEECHPPPHYADSAMLGPDDPLLHDVGTLGEGSGQRRGRRLTGLDTPELGGVALTGPWLHDGAAGTLEAAIAHGDPPSAAADLLQFLRELE